MCRVLPVGLALSVLLAVSAAAQRLPRCEIVTIDDDSTDNCTAKTNGHRQMVYTICLDDENGGAIEMLLYDNGEIIGFTEDDVQEWLPDVNHDGRIGRNRGIGPDERDSLNLDHQRKDITMRSITAVFALAAIFGFAVVPAVGHTYTFTADDGIWRDEDNWHSETGESWPQYGDTAIIQDGQHCHVQSSSENCTILKVLGGGTLTIEAPYFLKIGSHTEHTASMIGGDVLFLKETEGLPWLIIRQGGVTLSGDNGNTGTLNASKANNLGPGRIGTCDATTQVLTVSPGITVKGGLFIYVHVDNNGTFIVEHPDDEMLFRQVSDFQVPKIEGNGSFDVSAGTLTFDDCHLVYGLSATWNVTGANAKIHVTEEAECGSWPLHRWIASDINISAGELEVDQLLVPNRFTTSGKLDLSGGTLDLDGNFKVTGDLDFSGGTMQVALDKTAKFGPVPE